MSIVTNILDAIRRVGAPTQQSALKRQDDQLVGKVVLERTRTRIRNEAGETEVFVATVEPVPESVVDVVGEELESLRENAVKYGPLLLRHYALPEPNWSLKDLDEAFRLWITSGDTSVFTTQAVIELMGAMFGFYCAEHADMKWIQLTDQDGTTLALQGVSANHRVFPYQAISKRIADSEFGFFESIFVIAKGYSENPAYSYRVDASRLTHTPD